jgi:hypothetical protein
MNTKYNGEMFLANSLAFAVWIIVAKFIRQNLVEKNKIQILQILIKFICIRSPGTVYFQGSTGINIMNCFLPSS